MFSKLAVVVGLVAALHAQSAVAATPEKPGVTGPLDNYPADHAVQLPGFEGIQDDRCTPSGPNIRWNQTYFPCRYTRELDMKCAAFVPVDASDAVKQTAWEEQRQCLCVRNPDYFDVAGEGCVGCKKAYRLESEGNFKQYISLFKELEGNGYCKVEGRLTGDYAKYYADLAPKYPADYSNMPEPLPAKSIAVEDYWTPRDQKKAPAQPAPQGNTSANGIANLPPATIIAIGKVNMAPETNSSKFGSNTQQTAVFAVTIVNVRITANDKERKFEVEAPKPKLYAISISTQVSIKADVDFSACDCAKPLVPKGSRAVITQQSVKSLVEYSVKVGYSVSMEQQLSQQKQCSDCKGNERLAAVKTVETKAGNVEAKVDTVVNTKVNKVNRVENTKVNKVEAKAGVETKADYC